MSQHFAEARRSTQLEALIDRALLGLAATSLIYVVAALGGLLLSSTPLFNDSVYALTGIGPTVVGALLVIRRPGNVVGRLLVLIGSTWSLGEASRVYLWLDLHNGPLPLTDPAAWFVAWAFAPAFMLIPFLVLMFPNGVVAAGWLRWLIRVAAFAVGGLVAASMVTPSDLGTFGSYLEGRTNPWAIESVDAEGELADAIEVAMLLPVAALSVIAPIDLLVRWRRSDGVERLQMRSLALGVLIAVSLFFGSLALSAFNVPQALENAMVVSAISAMPIAIGVAVARYHLYDIDRVINRALVYASLTGALAATYFGIVVALQALLQEVSGGTDLAIALTTLAVAALFLPARRHVQIAVDRRFNRRAYDAALTVDAFSARLREQIDLDTLRYELLAVIGDTMQPSRASVWVRGGRYQ